MDKCLYWDDVLWKVSGDDFRLLVAIWSLTNNSEIEISHLTQLFGDIIIYDFLGRMEEVGLITRRDNFVLVNDSTFKERKEKEAKRKERKHVYIYNNNIYNNINTSINTRKREKERIVFVEGRFYGITDSQLRYWSLAFPTVDVEGEIRRAEAWLLANPRRRKKNYTRFITNWLLRCKPNKTRNNLVVLKQFLEEAQNG